MPAYTWRWLQDRIFDELNTLSVVYRAPATTFIDAEQGAGVRMRFSPAAREPLTVGLVAPPAAVWLPLLPALTSPPPASVSCSVSLCTQRFEQDSIDLGLPSSHPTTLPC